MPNTILTTDVIAGEALDVLRNNAVMPSLVHRDYSSDFVPGVGSKITIRKPATFEAKEFAGTTTTQDATEQGVVVTMDKHLDVTFAVTSKELTMSIADFSAEFLTPAMQAFLDKVDGYLIAAAVAGAGKVATTANAVGQADIVAARQALVKAKAPTTERYLVAGSTISRPTCLSMRPRRATRRASSISRPLLPDRANRDESALALSEGRGASACARLLHERACIHRVWQGQDMQSGLPMGIATVTNCDSDGRDTPRMPGAVAAVAAGQIWCPKRDSNSHAVAGGGF